MLTKILASILLTGSLVVAGDATFQKIGCCLPQIDCPFSGCCHGTPTSTSSESSSTETKSDCCSAPSRAKAKASCKESCCSEE